VLKIEHGAFVVRREPIASREGARFRPS
jgi:hypothetical protein